MHFPPHVPLDRTGDRRVPCALPASLTYWHTYLTLAFAGQEGPGVTRGDCLF